ncbi:hypothetical protein ZWY2020_037023 [Hordeum vulgare]|nr:hypothetical protein ZWY2020_037023 [Hordeum vulgare]
MVVPLPSLELVSASVAAAAVHRGPILSFRRSLKAWAVWAEEPDEPKDGYPVELPVSLARPKLGAFLEAAWQARARARPAASRVTPASRRRLPSLADRSRPTSVLARSGALPGLSPRRRPFPVPALVALSPGPLAPTRRRRWSRGRGRLAQRRCRACALRRSDWSWLGG